MSYHRSELELPSGRAALRSAVDLDRALADELLEFEGDFATTRRDKSLARVVEAASSDALLRHVTAIAAGSAADALWHRLDADPDELVTVANSVVAGQDARAAENTLLLLAMDPVNTHGLSDAQRTTLALAAMDSPHAQVQELAAELLFEANPTALLDQFDERVRNDSERIRGLTWLAALSVAPRDALDIALALSLDEAEPIDARRSALASAASHARTEEMVDALSVLVLHPDERLATDAAELLHRLHRHPVVAEAALHSQHAGVRQIAEALLDPLRGSPAAGGARSDVERSPTTADIFRDMVRQAEERARDGS